MALVGFASLFRYQSNNLKYDLLLHLGKRRRISLIRTTIKYYSTLFGPKSLVSWKCGKSETLSPVPSAGILRRAETMPDSNDVLPTV